MHDRLVACVAAARLQVKGWCLTVALVLSVGSCSVDSLVGNSSLPAGITDPGSIHTVVGAVETYRGTRTFFAAAFIDYVASSGLLGDEQEFGSGLGDHVNPGRSPLDRRVLPEGVVEVETDPLYSDLAQTRGQAEQSAMLLSKYSPDSVQMRAHVAALEGYSELLLNEFFCSGVPLSTLNETGNFTYASGSSTQDIYQHAITVFDSALALSGDDGQVANLARVGKARALLGSGNFAQAAQVAALVPDGFTYSVQVPTATTFTQQISLFNSVGDHEGLNGLDYVSSGDPRTATQRSGQLNIPLKHSPDALGPYVVADWVEARLIQAEAALQASPNDTASQGTGWLGILNHLRETAFSPALPDTTDPGSPDARVNLLFRERGFWLFLTGHRQGDLRRLIRQYHRDETTVYPVGPYDAGSGSFGSDVTAPVPMTERQYNPRFTGCQSRGA